MPLLLLLLLFLLYIQDRWPAPWPVELLPTEAILLTIASAAATYFIAKYGVAIDTSMSMSDRELSEIATEDGILTSAYKPKIPIYCPAITDSPIGVGIAASRISPAAPPSGQDRDAVALKRRQAPSRSGPVGGHNVGRSRR